MKMYFRSRSAARNFVAKAKVANSSFRVSDSGKDAKKRWAAAFDVKSASVSESERMIAALEAA